MRPGVMPGACLEIIAPPTSPGMTASEPRDPVQDPIDDTLDAQTGDRSDAAPGPEEEVSFEDEEAGLSVADIDTAVTQLREQPFPASAYPGSIGDVSVAKLRSSIVAPLVAQARGYRTIAGSEDARDTLRRLDLDGRRNPGRHLLSLAKQGDRKSTRLNSSHVAISYAVIC